MSNVDDTPVDLHYDDAMSRIAYFDCFSGAGGDMIVGALLDAGVDANQLRNRLTGLGLTGFRMAIERVKRHGFAATRFSVALEESVHQPHRHLKHIVDLLARVELPEAPRQKAIQVFQRLAAAEARVHGSSVEKVHFHEVGAVDALLDVVGAMTCLEMLGVDRVVCSPIPVGSGMVNCAHGLMPVPAPATAQLLVGVPLAACDEPGELTTPTAAAVLTTVSESFGPMPPMAIRAVGYGAGAREGVRRPNLLRVVIGESVPSPADAHGDEITVLETQIDDLSPQVVGYCLERLLSAGALDAFAVPIHMKKWRSGLLITLLCEPARVADLEQILFTETTTLGVRRHNVTRSTLIRRHESVKTAFGEIRVKVAERAGARTASPEYEDCKEAALRHGVPLREVIAAAQRALS